MTWRAAFIRDESLAPSAEAVDRPNVCHRNEDSIIDVMNGVTMWCSSGVSLAELTRIRAGGSPRLGEFGGEATYGARSSRASAVAGSTVRGE